MADEKNGGGSVDELLKKLRLQVNQLGEAFGIDSDDAKSNTENTASDDASPENTPPKPKMTTDELLRSLAKTLEPREEALPETPTEQVVTESREETEASPPVWEATTPVAEETPPVLPQADEPLEQIDFFEAFDAAPAASPATEALPDAPETEEELLPEEDDAPVFVKTDAPVLVQKESISPATVLAADAEERKTDGVIVTETERATPTEDSDAQIAAGESFFVPNADPPASDVAENAPPISNESRFDPSRYDELLSVHGRKTQVAESREEEPPQNTEKVRPHSPVLMPDRASFGGTSTSHPTPTAGSEVLPMAEVSPEEKEAPVAEALPAEDATPVSAAPTEDTTLLAEELSAEDETPVAEALPTEDTAPVAVEIPEAVAPSSTVEPPQAATPFPFSPSEEAANDAARRMGELLAANEPADAPHAPLQAHAGEPQRKKKKARIVDARPEWSETDRELRVSDPTGRIHIVSDEYRVGEAEEMRRRSSRRLRTSQLGDGEEDYINELPGSIRDPISNHPLGLPDRTKPAEEAETPKTAEAEPLPKTPRRKKKKRAPRYFHEEIDGTHEGDRATDYVRHHLREEVHGARIRLIVIAVVAFMLLLFENITRISLAPSDFVDAKTAGFVDAFLLLGASLAAFPRLRAGAQGFVIGRILPESILLVEVGMAFVYAVVYGILGTGAVFFSFVPALGLAVLYVFHVIRCETRRKSFEKLIAAGEKLVLSPITDPDASETALCPEKTAGARPLVYRVRKTGFVEGFSTRTTAVSEDERLNLVLLIGTALVSVACFILALVWKDGDVASAFEAFFFSFFLTAPIAMLGVHVYAISRTDEVAGAGSAVLGEATVREATSARAVSFEDVEAVPSTELRLANFDLLCDDPTTVVKYLTALYAHIGGPLCGYFTGMYVGTSVTAAPLVELVEATENGVNAVIDGAEVVVGNGDHMLNEGITPTYDAADEAVLADGKHGVLYVAINGMICMKLYIEYGISAEFARNATYLYRRGIAAFLRTYDPNFTERILSGSEYPAVASARVVDKKLSERGDFYALHAESGIVTAENSSKLLSLLLLCFRTRNALRFGWVYKLMTALLGGALAVFLTLLGAYGFIPSVYPALYHVILVFGYLLYARLCIRLPDVTKEIKPPKEKKKSNEK